MRCTARGGNPAPTLMWRLGDAWVEAEPTTEELEEGTVRMVFAIEMKITFWWNYILFLSQPSSVL